MPEKKLALFDFDDTLYKGNKHYVILDFPQVLNNEGKFPTENLLDLDKEISIYKENMKNFPNDENNRNTFTNGVIDVYYKGIEGCDVKDIERISKQWIHHPDFLLYPYARELVNLMNEHEMETILISGSPFEVIAPIGKELGFHSIWSTKGKVNTFGKFSGKVDIEFASEYAKRKLIQSFSCNPEESFAFGDSDSDFPLLEIVNPHNAFLFRDKDDAIASRARENGWQLLYHTDDIIKAVKERLGQISP